VASRGFPATARLSCVRFIPGYRIKPLLCTTEPTLHTQWNCETLSNAQFAAVAGLARDILTLTLSCYDCRFSEACGPSAVRCAATATERFLNLHVNVFCSASGCLLATAYRKTIHRTQQKAHTERASFASWPTNLKLKKTSNFRLCPSFSVHVCALYSSIVPSSGASNFDLIWRSYTSTQYKNKNKRNNNKKHTHTKTPEHKEETTK